MHVYFYGPTNDKPELRQAYQQIYQALKQADLWISTNTKPDQVQVSAEVMAESKQSGVPLMDRMDAFIIEGSTSDPEIGFLIAHAMALKKPTLYLYRRGMIPQVFSHLTQTELPKFIKVVSYTETNLSKAVLGFLTTIEGLAVREIPHLKFTLRLTDSMDEYLHHRTHNTKQTKADFLRDELKRLMDADDDWKQFQRKRRVD